MAEDETHLYVIELEPVEDMNAQWYVGITNDPERRYQTHKSGDGAVWTRRNKPVDMYVVDSGRRGMMRELEDHLTALLMDQYGTDSTRGGGCTTARPASFPRCREKKVDPGLAERLGETGNAKLARFADRAAMFCKVQIEEEFESSDDFYEWADGQLPTGTEIEIKFPGLDPVTYVSEDPPEEE